MNEAWAQRLMDKCGVAWFKCDEASGNVLDSKGNAVGTPTNISFQREEGIYFDGTSSNVVFNNRITSLGRKSIYFEMKSTQNNDDSHIWIIHNQLANNKSGISFLQHRITKRLSFEYFVNHTPIPGTVGTALNLFDGKWHSVLFIEYGHKRELYIDDMKSPKAVVNTVLTGEVLGNTNLTLGWYGISSYYKGNLRNIQIYNDVIDPIAKFNLVKSQNKIHILSEDSLIYPNIQEPLTQADYEKWGMDSLEGYENEIDKVLIEMDESGVLGNGRVLRKVVNKNEFKINGLGVR